jgi:predicted NAD-dependent protein-ADP-ribosyltransferase YbiA (DUF1768 family)
MIAWLLSLSLALAGSNNCPYPKEWWKPATQGLEDWEILPQSVSCFDRKVILSKRNELGIFSNFAETPFVLDSKKYASVEGFWQMMKYPEDLKDPSDPRNNPKVEWPYTRAQVAKMVASQAKDAGKIANSNLKKLNISWITYQGQRIEYKGKDQDIHYKIIFSAQKAKMDQNPEVRSLLLKTKGLDLLPDHKVEDNPPPAYRYYDIWEALRDN